MVRPIFLAVDGKKRMVEVMDTIAVAMDGPIGPYMAGVKLNDAVHIVGGGPTLVGAVLAKYSDLGVCLDFKMADVSATDANIIGHYAEDADRLLTTVSVHSSVKTFVELLEKYPKIEVIAMGVPTDMPTEECVSRYGLPPADAMRKWYGILAKDFRSAIGQHDGPDNILPTALAVMSFDMIGAMCKTFPGLGAFTPGIRDDWMAQDHQVRKTGIAAALKLGARYVVMGAQLTKGNPDAGIDATKSQELTAAEIEKFYASQKV